MSKRTSLMGALLILFLGLFLFGTSGNLLLYSSLRRIKSEPFRTILEDLRSGEKEKVSLTYHQQEHKVEIKGRYLEDQAVFLSLQAYEERNGQPLGYYLLFPTREGYFQLESVRKNIGNFSNLGPLVQSLLQEVKEVFFIEKTLPSPEVFNPSSLEILHSWLAPYYFEKSLPQAKNSFWAFLETVDQLQQEGDVSATTIEKRLNAVYGDNSFNGFGFYYWIAKNYLSELLRIKRRGFALGKGREEIEEEMFNYIQRNIAQDGPLAPENLIRKFPLVSGILPVSEFLPASLDKILEGEDGLLSLVQAEREILADIRDGFRGWIGILDLDQLRLINKIYSKQLVNFLLADIRKVLNYYLSQKGGFGFQYRVGDEIGIYLPSAQEEGVREIMQGIREKIGEIRYGIFVLSEQLDGEEWDSIEDILEEQNAYISERRYAGEQMGIIRFKKGEGGDKLFRMMSMLRRRLNREVGFSYYLEDKMKGVIFPTFSGGIVSLQEVDSDMALAPIFYKAQDRLGEAKRQGKDTFLIGYRPEYWHSQNGNSLISEEFREILRKFDSEHILPEDETTLLTPAIYNEESFREKVSQIISETDRGLLLMLSPYYDEEEGLHEVNERYTLQGGDEVIRTIAYFSKLGFERYDQEALLSRRVDKMLVFIPGFEDNFRNYEELLRIVSQIKQNFQSQIPQIDIEFEVSGALVEEGVRDNPGLLFQRVEYGFLEPRPILKDLWGNLLYLYGRDTEERVAEIERAIVEESLQDLIVQILELRILPALGQHPTLEGVRVLSRRDALLSRISFDYILEVIRKKELLS